MNNIKRTLALILSVNILCSLSINAQDPEAFNVEEPIIIAPLFDYPSAPEELTDLTVRSNWLMEHFWDKMDFKSSDPVDQNALNDAFSVYTSAMLYADKDKVMKSIGDMTNKLKQSPLKALQFAKAAEENMYGGRAIMWCDETYIPFLKTVISVKGLPESRIAKYKGQLETLEKNAIGKKFPKLRLTVPGKRHKEFVADTEYTIVEIGNPDCDDCRFSKIKLEMASDINRMVEDGQLKILFLVADAVPEDETMLLDLLSEYPANWVTGISYGADDILDIRQTPTFYVLGKGGVILAKNLDVTGAVDKIREFDEKKK